MSVYEIPLVAGAQTFLVSLGGTEYRFTVTYLDVELGGYVLSIADTDGSAIVSSIPLVTGADLLAQHQHLNIGGSGRLILQTDGDDTAVPTYEGLGTTSRLYFVVGE